MANVSYTDEQATDTLTTATEAVEGAFTVDSYTLVNASANYRFGAQEEFKVGVYANNLTDENFCHGMRASDTGNLADPGNEYFTYLPIVEEGKVTIDLSAVEGQLEVEWFSPYTREVKDGGQVDGGESRTLVSPFGEVMAMVYLWRK